MVKIKTKKKTVMFNSMERELCGICGNPEGFCKHTIEKEYKDACPETPKDKEDIWQLIRSHALSQTYCNNLWHHQESDMRGVMKAKEELNEKIELLQKTNNKILNIIKSKDKYQ